MKKLRLILILLTGLFTFKGTLAESAPREKPRTEIVVDIAPDQFVNHRQEDAAKPNPALSRKISHPSLKKVIRHTLLGLLVVLALCGIPVVPPKRIEQDIDNETKTEIVEGSEEKD